MMSEGFPIGEKSVGPEQVNHRDSWAVSYDWREPAGLCKVRFIFFFSELRGKSPREVGSKTSVSAGRESGKGTGRVREKAGRGLAG